jgi:Meiotically up-regulated gene 113
MKYGFVYLARGHPGEYKIGRTNLVDRRLSELGATASVEQRLIHEIKTDDPSGVEAYWHQRFRVKRMRGEWFKLNAADVSAFKRWRRIF